MTKQTACDLLKEAKRIWYTPSKCEREQLESIAEDLYTIVFDLHEMIESMENRLIEYESFCSELYSELTSLKGERKW